MKKTILIYQMGKVGSLTIYKSILLALENCSADTEVVHTHSHDFARQRVLSSPEGKIVVLTLVRETLRRCISAFFQNVASPTNKFWYLGDRRAIEHMSIEDIIAAFRDRQWAHFHQRVEPWFHVFEEVTGAAVFDMPFPTQVGRWSWQSGSRKIGILRTENISRSKDWIEDLIGVPGLALNLENESSDKWYSEIYDEFLKVFRPTPKEICKYYGCRIMRHFYSEAEISNMIENWTRPR